MDLHRRWALFRAWRVRAWLAAALAAATWLLKPVLGVPALLLPLAALLYPLRWQLAPALADIDRSLGLVYRTALETPPADPAYPRLRAEAERAARAAVLPLPLREAMLALALWILAAAAPAYAPPPPPLERVAGGAAGEVGPAEGAAPRQSRPQEPFAGAREGAFETEAPRRPSQGDASREPVASGTRPPDETPVGGEPPQQPAAGERQGVGAAPAAREAGSAARAEGAAKTGGLQEMQPAVAGTYTRGGSATPAPEPGKDPAGRVRAGASDGLDGANGDGAGGPATGDTGRGEGVPSPRVAASPAGDGAVHPGGPPAPPPSPWAAGSPPPEVRRGAERYLQNAPLPPAAAEAVRRYFEITGSGY